MFQTIFSSHPPPLVLAPAWHLQRDISISRYGIQSLLRNVHTIECHSTRSLPPAPRLRRLLTASRCLRFHSRVSSPRTDSQRSRILASSSILLNSTLHTGPFACELCGKKNGSEASSALTCCVPAGTGVLVAATAVMVLGILVVAGTLFAKAGSSRSRSSSESRSRWPISEKPSRQVRAGE